MPISVLISGTGKMGRQVLSTVCAEPDLEPVGALDVVAPEEYLPLPDGSGLVPFESDPGPLLARIRPDVVVDFSNAEWTPQVATESLKVGSRLVIGTSGLTDAFIDELGKECGRRKLGVVVAANFALGAVLMTHLAKVASPFFDHAEIIEMHHDGKADAPSGTAMSTAREMSDAREKPFQRPAALQNTLEGARGGSLDGVTIHSVRLPGLVAHQEVIFGGSGQTLTIRHDATSRESFMPGVVLAVREVMRRQDLILGLEGLLGI